MAPPRSRQQHYLGAQLKPFLIQRHKTVPPTVLFAQMHNPTTIVVYFRGPSVQTGQFLHHCVMNKPGLLPQNLVHTSTGITSLQESIPH